MKHAGLMAMTLAEMVERLGKPEDFICTTENYPLLKRWAIAAGHPAASVHIMSRPELTNLYHDQAKKSKPVEADLNSMFIKILTAVQVPGFSAELQRMITQEELRTPAAMQVYMNAAAQAAQAVYDKLPPKRIEIAIGDKINPIEATAHYATETVLRIVALGHPVMMVGPAGCGKTTIGEHVAQGLGLPFYITSTINDTHELTGFIDGHGAYHSTPFRQAFQNGGVWVADEIDAWDASALLAANSALANGYTTFPDMPLPVRRHPDFRMIATANTFGSGADRVYIGRNELDAASLDRFATVNVSYDINLERIFANGNNRWLEHVWRVRKKVQERKIRHVVSSRAITMGAAALAAGLQWPEVQEIYLYKGMSKSDREKIA